MTNKNSDPFQAFMSASPSQAPRWVADELSLAIRKDLEPSWWNLGSKLVGLHLLAGGISLWLCPQFGVGGDDHASRVMRTLMPYGEIACAAGCGAVFSSLTALAAAGFLTRDERRIVAKKELWVFSLMMAASWAALMITGGAGFNVAFSAVWLLAATLGAQSVFASLRRLRALLA